METLEFSRQKRACNIGIKAVQNIRAAHEAFSRLCEVFEARDPVYLVSLFHHGIIRYAKPFTISDMKNAKKIKYPVRQIKDTPQFSIDIHNHLLTLRNTLIAHDDFQSIEPKLLITSWSILDKYTVPVAIEMSNKCIDHPSEQAAAVEIKNHVEAALTGVMEKLQKDLISLRQLILNGAHDPSKSILRFQMYAPASPNGEITATMPSREPWLKPSAPDFGSVSIEYSYEECRVASHFIGTETFPDGSLFQTAVKGFPTG